MRANAKNFSTTEIKKACVFAHSLRKKLYVTVNIAFHNDDYDGLVDYDEYDIIWPDAMSEHDINGNK